MNLVISDKEVNVRRAQGTVYLCRPCSDLKRKNVLVSTDLNGPKEVRYALCENCKKLLTGCSTCRGLK